MNSEHTTIIEDFIRRVTEYMQIPCECAVHTEENGSTRVAIRTNEDGRLLIGKNGQNLKALEQVVRLVLMRQQQEYRGVVVDVNDYRAEQTQKLVESVHAAAVRVQQTRKSEALDPMSSYQRRVVHTELAVYSDLATESVGQEPHRRVVIKPL
jgi:spoIIIJ-associated protein